MNTKDLNDNDSIWCSDLYNFRKTGEVDGKEIFVVCSRLIECVRKDFEKIVSQKNGLISHGLCEDHAKQARAQIKKDVSL